MMVGNPYRTPGAVRPRTKTEKREDRRFGLALLFMLFLCLPVVAFHTGCGFMADEDQAVRAVTNLGFTDVKVESRMVFFLDWRGCGKSDDAGFRVSATNPKGQRVSMLVCVGWPFKGATVRSL